MGLNFRKSIRIGKNFRINLSKSGVGVSAGVKGARVGIGPRGIKKTLSVPGTGIYYTEQHSLNHPNGNKDSLSNNNRSLPQKNKRPGCGCLTVIVIIVIVFFGIIGHSSSNSSQASSKTDTKPKVETQTTKPVDSNTKTVPKTTETAAVAAVIAQTSAKNQTKQTAQTPIVTNSNNASTTNQTSVSNSQESQAPEDIQYVDANGNGLIKGSEDNIYHIPGSTYYSRTKKVKQWFKTIREAEAAGYRAPER